MTEKNPNKIQQQNHQKPTQPTKQKIHPKKKQKGKLSRSKVTFGGREKPLTTTTKSHISSEQGQSKSWESSKFFCSSALKKIAMAQKIYFSVFIFI